MFVGECELNVLLRSLDPALRNPLNARTVVRPSVTKILLFGIREFILLRNRIYVRSAAHLFMWTHSLFTTNCYTLERGPTDIKYGKRLHSNSNLVQHQKIYTGQKACQCKECGKAFGQTGNLNEHQQICPCKTDIKESSGLEQHQIKAHDKEGHWI